VAAIYTVIFSVGPGAEAKTKEREPVRPTAAEQKPKEEHRLPRAA